MVRHDFRAIQVRRGEVVKKEAIDVKGKKRVLYAVDAHSATFGSDLERIFRRNVARARRENKRIVGAVDRIP